MNIANTLACVAASRTNEKNVAVSLKYLEESISEFQQIGELTEHQWKEKLSLRKWKNFSIAWIGIYFGKINFSYVEIVDKEDEFNDDKETKNVYYMPSFLQTLIKYLSHITLWSKILLNCILL